jgi:E3 ubiquitin-protein ligase SIAH1
MVFHVLLRILECPACMEYIEPPTKICYGGHSICSRCKDRVQYCPTCRANILETRNLALENIARILKYPCRNRESGCLDWFSIEHIADHHAVCVYEKIKCPFKIRCNCPWQGIKSCMKEHAKAAHPEWCS